MGCSVRAALSSSCICLERLFIGVWVTFTRDAVGFMVREERSE